MPVFKAASVLAYSDRRGSFN